MFRLDSSMLSEDIMKEQEFLKHFIQNAPRLMWFLGAGTSRSAGLPTANDIIWDLKRKYYCLQENQDFQSHDINNKAIKNKIQEFMESKGFPPLWNSREYTFYFELTFGNNYAAQQKYLNEILSTDKISLTVGHRALAALLEMGLARIVFTTNFDEVVESAYASVTGRNLSTFHLEGSYAALDALNSERFPIYAKIHGDFRYQSIKNLTADLLDNDRQLQRCFLAAVSRYGLVVSGYSGRDENVMAMLREAMAQNNAFPHGLFWTVPRISSVPDSVKDAIKFAETKGISAHIVETGTFDEMLSKMWRQVPERPPALDSKVRTAIANAVSISLPPSGSRYPILRTNALPVVKAPSKCGTVDYADTINYPELKDRIFQNQPDAVIAYTDRILFWGKTEELEKVLVKEKMRSFDEFDLDDPSCAISNSTFVKSFFEEALARALCNDKPLLLRRDKGRTYYAVIKHGGEQDDIFLPLRRAVGFQGKPGAITGKVPQLTDVYWAESIALKLDERNGILWLLIRPDIWVSPLVRRPEAVDFLRKRRLHRYNNAAYQILDSWINILLGSVGHGGVAKVACFPDAKYGLNFEIGTRTGYSRGVGSNG